jgi:hypothetical protein
MLNKTNYLKLIIHFLKKKLEDQAELIELYKELIEEKDAKIRLFESIINLTTKVLPGKRISPNLLSISTVFGYNHT